MAYAGPAWDDTLAKYGQPAERVSQGMKKSLAMTQLLNLKRTQQGVDTNNARAKATPVPYGALPHSGFLGERDYTDNLKRKAEITDLESRLSGQGPARMGGGTTMGPATSALRRRAGFGGARGYDDDGVGFNQALSDDTLDFQTRSIQRDRMLGAANEDVAESLRRSSDHRAKTDPYEARRRGDIGRGEHVRDEETRGAGEVARYQAPGAGAMRRGQMWDKEEELRRFAPYTPSIINSGNRLEGQRVGADARVDSAQIAGDSRVAGAAIGAVGRLGSAPTFSPEDRAARDNATSMVGPNVPGQGPVQQEKLFPRAKLAAWAKEKGFTEQAAEEYLRTVAGYVVR